MAQAISPIRKNTERDLAILKKAGILDGFYLAGGTALALFFGHRISHDLDFFRRSPFDEKKLAERLRGAGSFSIETIGQGTLSGQFETTRLSFFHYPYPLLKPLRRQGGIQAAAPEDIACMKLDAVASRGTKRDFIDIYIIVKKTGMPLAGLLKRFSRKYKGLSYNLMHIKKSLVYFSDAESDPMPRMLEPLNWKEVKRFLASEMKKI